AGRKFWHRRDLFFQGHTNAMIAWKENERADKADALLISTLTKEHHKQIEENRAYIKSLAEVLLLTATQNISQRGHREKADADNRENFLKITRPRNAKYTSHQIPNEICDTLAEIVHSSIINKVKESEVFSLTADEIKDLKKKEQISLVLRYYYAGAVKESFLHFFLYLRDVAWNTKRLNVFVSGSYIHKWLNIQKEIYPGEPRELQRLSETMWACRHIACHTVLDRLSAIMRLLEEMASENSGDRSIDARGLLAQFDLQFIGLLVICNKVFGDARCLSDILQSPSLDLCSSVDLVQALVQSFQAYRDESYFEGLREILNTAEKCDVEVEPTSKRKTKQSRRLDGHTVMSSTGESSEQSMDTFRTSIFYPVLDTMLSELNRRFAKPNSIPNEILLSSSIVELTKIIEPFKEVFNGLFRLCKIAIAIPVSNASCESSFSTLKLIKTHLRSTIDDDRLSSLGILSALVLKLQPSFFGNVIPSSEKLILQSPPNTHCEDDVCYSVFDRCLWTE
uniref:HAT C-terminal dimerisation domain-containing protein n=1 Tax=Scophthalmus maximus TaxID=52904 RepID=A0A8D3E2D0_SCOMX